MVYFDWNEVERRPYVVFPARSTVVSRLATTSNAGSTRYAEAKYKSQSNDSKDDENGKCPAV